MSSDSNLKASFEICEKIARAHYENFPVASLLFPKNKRKYVYCIYCFARTADDIADSETLSPGEKISRLEKYEFDFLNSLKGNWKNIEGEQKYIFIALSDTIRTFKLSENQFLQLLKAFKQDAMKNRYSNFEELLEYSDNSANPIGHLMLAISGFKEINNREMYEYSDKICTALQLINFWQDVSRDLKINRIYIPVDLMERYKYSAKFLSEGVENENFKAMITELVSRTRNILGEGKPLMNILKGKLKLEFKAIYNGGMSILNKIEDIDYKVLSRRVELNFKDKFGIFIRVLL